MAQTGWSLDEVASSRSIHVPGRTTSGRVLVNVTARSACSASSSTAVGGVRLGWGVPGAPTITIRTTATSDIAESGSQEAWPRKR